MYAIVLLLILDLLGLGAECCARTTIIRLSSLPNTFTKYGWTIVGTIVSADKKSRVDEDILFLKLSNGTRNGVK